MSTDLSPATRPHDLTRAEPTTGPRTTPEAAASPNEAGAANAGATRTHTAWASVLVMMATSFTLVVAEFLPPSLLPQMAASLNVSEGQAGQAVTMTALAGFLAGPGMGILFPRLDRRTLLAGLALAATVSNIVVAISGNLVLLLIARLLLGAALGGFWAMSLAVAAKLSAPRHMGRAVMLINTGTTMATVAGVPLGLFLGTLTNWRVVFVVIAAISIVVAAALRFVLPSVAPAAGVGIRMLGQTLATPGIALALVGHVLVVMGHFAAFTYVRGAFARTPELDAGGVATLLALFGVGGLVGNIVIGLIIDKHLRLMRFLVPALTVIGVAAIALFPNQLPVIGVAVVVWGFGFGAWLTVITTWLGRVVPERMEAGGGLLVAGFQLAITLGAGIGGILVDSVGVTAAFLLGAAAGLVGLVLFGTARTKIHAPVSERS
ncbi:MFS transporter [Schumannella soli]|uniref:MFS transporter n=1 Tax=Schumannella soli TaxID=2590779 RepID=A0A506Y3L5_9MICO|nr:MFS transporter [Schumannella soli]TPW75588.1 MFS transporter [Schumannella soli]